MLAPFQALLRKATDSLGHRRGTVLLLVLGSLALVLILAVVYAAVGRGDRRTARETAARADALSGIDAVTEHILDTLANDVFNLVPEVSDSTAMDILGVDVPVMRREAVDMPVTDWYFTSVPPRVDGVGNNINAVNTMRFRPDGGHDADLIWDRPPTSGAPFDRFDIDPRTASDPFLAATRPVDLGASNMTLTANLPPYMRMRDWAQISNFAPDGRFVNLFYLRNGFAAPSIDLTVSPGGNTSRLSLFDANGRPTSELPYGDMLNPSVASDNADWNKPMHWTMNQRWLFRPITDPALQNTGDPLGDPGDADYWAYQYADADGDGFLDSRWIELVDYTNPNRPVSVMGDSDMRFFVAARAIDLSSLVNVATATDFLTPPTLANRIGAGPQDISLFKLLNFSEHTLSVSAPADIDPNTGGVGYTDAFDTGTGMAGDYGGFSNLIAQTLGRKAYLRLADGSRQGQVQPFGVVPGEQNAQFALSEDLRDYTQNLDPEDRLEYAAAVGSAYPGVSAGGNSRTAPYSIDDLVELLTFHGINDDRNFSKLEQAMSSVNGLDNVPFSSYSLVRSDTTTASDAWPDLGDVPLKYMRSAVDIRRMLTTVSGSRPLRSSILEQADFPALSESADRKILLDSLVLSDGTYPTATINPADAIVDINDQQSELLANTFRVYLDLLAPDLRELDWEQDASINPNYEKTKTQYYGHMGPELAVRLAGHMALNFRDMADAPYVINPATGLPDATLMPAGADRFDILDLDLSDATDLDAYNRRVDEPSVAALRLALDWNPDIATGLLKELWDAGLKLDVNEVLNPPGTPVAEQTPYFADDGRNTSHHAMIQYGIEPQPFLSQVSSMSMYMDVDYGSDDELGTSPQTGEWRFEVGGPTGNPDIDGMPNIDGNADDAANADFLFQALFVQVFNPFDVPIVLDRYYIEFANSFYSVSDGTSAPVVLQPRSTVVLWASNPNDSAVVTDRLSTQLGTLPRIFGTPERPPAPNQFEAMIRAQVGNGVEIVHLKKRYGVPSRTIVGSGSAYNEILGTDVQDIFHDDPAAKSDANRVVMLWRDNASYTNPAMGRIDWSSGSFTRAERATDQLVDRLRDASALKAVPIVGPGGAGANIRAALDRRLNLPTLTSRVLGVVVNDAIKGDAGHRAGPTDIDPAAIGLSFINYNNGMRLGVALWGNISRKDDSAFDSGRAAVDYYTGNLASGATGQGNDTVSGTPVGALPAKVFEPSAHSGNGLYLPYSPSTKLMHEFAVAGDELKAFPEGLDLLDDFGEDAAAPVEDSPNPGVTHVVAADLWAALQAADISPEFFAGLRTPVFARGSAVALSTPIQASEVTDFGNYQEDRYIKVTVNQTEFRDLVSGRRTLRVGDMLLPLAVGAYRTPLEPGPGGEPATPDGLYSNNVLERLNQYEAQWTTLGEALAAAAGYSDSVGPGPSNPSLAVDDPFRSLSFAHTAGNPIGTAKQEKYVLDRGQLRLDAFVPFIDMAGPQTEGSGDFDPLTDIRRGLGIPMALNIFDMAQAGTDMGILAMGGLDRPVMGTINANTAEPEVLRLHPALAMDMFASSGADVLDRLWWPRTLINQTLNPQGAYRLNLFEDPTAGGTPATFADVGSFIAAYRDTARYTQLNLGSALGASMPVEVDAFPRMLLDDSDASLGLRIARDPDPMDPAATPRSGIVGIRNGQGILSMGELFAARDMRVAPDNKVHHQMGGFARDDRTIGIGFVDMTDPDDGPDYARGADFYTTPLDPAKINKLRAGEIRIATFGNHPTGDLIGLALNYGTALTVPGNGDAYPGMGGAALPIMPDQIPDSYDEQLVQLNAVLNSMSVRSDYYAVWFIVHGYKESDTVGLTDSDPLTPSFAARYLLILDRSNVTEKGDRPRVLARVQLPMLPPPPAGTF